MTEAGDAERVTTRQTGQHGGIRSSALRRHQMGTKNAGKITRGDDFTLAKEQSRFDDRQYSFTQRTINA